MWRSAGFLQRFVAAQAPKGGVTPAQSGLLFVPRQGRDGRADGRGGGRRSISACPVSAAWRTGWSRPGLIEEAPPDSERRPRLAAVADASGAAGALARTKTNVAELNVRLTEGFSEAEIDIVARGWLASLQTKFPKGDDA